MAVDIVPEMLARIRQQVDARLEKDKTIKHLKKLFEEGKGTYKEANEFAIRVGEILADAYRMNVSEAELPNGRMWYNIADRVLTPTLQKNYQLIAEACEQAQKNINQEIRVGLRVIKPAENKSRIQNLVQKISDYEAFSEAEWMLQEPVINIAQSVVDDAIKANMEFQGSSGIQATIHRTVVGGCCEWCAKIAGKYTYPKMPKEVFQRHEYCRCMIEYTPSRTGRTERLRGTGKSWK